eukprot:214412_1
MEWLQFEERKGDHINAKTMAICGIVTLIVHKVVSTIAFWIKERSFYRCVLQFLDLLVFEEIYVTHKKIVAEFTNQSSSNPMGEAVETTTSFKYVRSLEAAFESMPQSVLQLVFILRTAGTGTYKKDVLIISLLSIFQSIVSMTNSIIKNDNIYMCTPKWKRHKKRLPPSIPFLKHIMCRLSEVFYRIVLLALFWTVCGGQAFSVLLAAEVFFIVSLTVLEYNSPIGVEHITTDEAILRIQSLVVLPSELIFALDGTKKPATNCSCKKRYVCYGVCWSIWCCYWPSVLLSTLCRARETHYVHVTFRIGTSLVEWVILIAFAIPGDELFSREYRLTLFIIGCVLFMIYTQYLYLLPNFRLPFGVNIRGKYGYAFRGELEELQRIKEDNFELRQVLIEVVEDSNVGGLSQEEKDQQQQRLRNAFQASILKCMDDCCDKDVELSDAYVRGERWEWKLIGATSFFISFDENMVLHNSIISDLEPVTTSENITIGVFTYNPWEETAGAWAGQYDDVMSTAAVFAIASGHTHVVEWLEDVKKARNHKADNKNKLMSIARRCIDPDHVFFDEEFSTPMPL